MRNPSKIIEKKPNSKEQQPVAKAAEGRLSGKKGLITHFEAPSGETR